jgi:hypothetical protein
LTILVALVDTTRTSDVDRRRTKIDDKRIGADVVR